MTPEKFKKRWNQFDINTGITWIDIANCAKYWGLFNNPRKTSMHLVRYKVLKHAGIADAEAYHPDKCRKSDDDDDW